MGQLFQGRVGGSPGKSHEITANLDESNKLGIVTYILKFLFILDIVHISEAVHILDADHIQNRPGSPW